MSRSRAIVSAAIFIAASAIYAAKSLIIGSIGVLVALIGPSLLNIIFNVAYGILVLIYAWIYRASIRRVLGYLGMGLNKVEKSLFGWMPKHIEKRMVALFLGIIVSVLIVFLSQYTVFFNNQENRVLDIWFRWMFPIVSQAQEGVVKGTAEVITGRERIREDVIIVKLDNDIVYRFGWPLPRKYYAQLIEVLSKGNPKSIFFDIALIDESADHPEWDRAIGEAAARAGNVYFGYPIESELGTAVAVSEESMEIGERNSFGADQIEGPYLDFSAFIGTKVKPDFVIADVARGAKGVASINIMFDEDDVLRRGALAFKVGNRVYPSAALRVAMDELDVPFDKLRIVGGKYFDIGGKVQVPIDKTGRTIVRYHGRYDEVSSKTFLYVPFFEVIRKDFILILPNNPVDPGQFFDVDYETEITLDGKPVKLENMDLSILSPSLAVQGKAIASGDSLRITELKIDTGGTSVEPLYEMTDEGKMIFRDNIGDAYPRHVDPSTFEGKHIFIGSTATGAFDLRNTPVGNIPGVEYHATLFNNILNKDFIVPVSPWINIAIILIVGLLMGGVTPFLRPLQSMIMLVVTAIALVIGVYVAFREGMYTLLVSPILTLFFSYLLIMVYRFMSEEREKMQVRTAFQYYVTASVVNELLKNPDMLKLGGEKRELTVFFSDIAGFTTISESLTPEEVVALINEYLTEMTDIVFEYDGTLDKYEGDAIMAFWGAPIWQDDHARRACYAALDMQERLVEMRKRWAEEKKPLIHVRAGINTGEMIVGNMGSKERMDYTVMGDSVNLGARLEPANKQYNTRVMIGERTYELAKEYIEARELDAIRVKGKTLPVITYELLAKKGQLPQNIADVLEHYNNGLKAYKERRWKDGIQAFRDALRINGDDGPSKVYLGRCIEYAKNPPPDDWDGVFTMTTK
ncbi:MAG: CHASE2 domain-containing protein [bacterium]